MVNNFGIISFVIDSPEVKTVEGTLTPNLTIVAAGYLLSVRKNSFQPK